MISAIFKTFSQFIQPAFWRIFLLSLIVSGVLLGLSVWAGIWFADGLPETGTGWIDWIIDKVAPLSVVFMALFLYPALASMVMGLFLDDIAEAVEQKHYPGDAPGTPIGVGTGLWEAAKLGGEIVLENLIALQFCLIFRFFPLLSFALYYLINGYLLNKEYFELVAQRHGDKTQEKALRKRHGGKLFLGGCAIAFMFSIPLVNLMTPLLATGLMVHLFKGFQQEGATHVA